MITKINFGKNDETVRPYNEETSKCFRRGPMYASRTFNTKIAVIKPIVKNQKATFILLLSNWEGKYWVIDFNQ